MSNWTGLAIEELLRLRAGAAGWGYQPGGSPCVEPTVLASLGLLASPFEPHGGRARRAAEVAAEWLARIQQDDGSLGISENLPRPGWPTALAVILWSNLPRYSLQSAKATAWLLARRGRTYPYNWPGSPVGHDTTIAGWPWVEQTHSWLEPTAMAVLALRGAGFGGHRRTGDGLRLIRDRAIPTGGWNYGNPALFGTNLRPLPASTGLALLALAGVESWNPTIQLACRYLKESLPQIRSPQSLCWGVLGLAAWGHRPREADRWLAEAYDQALRRLDRAALVAYLLLAASRQSLGLLGLGALDEDRLNVSRGA